jgi:hypothetical protein
VTSTPPPAALLALATHLDLAASHVAATDIVLVMPISQSECFAFFGGGSELLVVRLLKVDALPVEVLLEVVDGAGCFFFFFFLMYAYVVASFFAFRHCIEQKPYIFTRLGFW